MTYTETLDKLAAETEAQVVAAFRSWEEGLLSLSDFLAVATAYLAAAGNRATALADTALAAFLTATLGQPVAALGLIPEDVDRRTELATLAAREDLADPPGRFGRFARAVTLAAAQDAYSAAMRERGIPAWTRVLNAGACELCQDLAGEVLPGSAPMYHHDGCGCTQRPILNTGRANA
jgi:hypothetical protein